MKVRRQKSGRNVVKWNRKGNILEKGKKKIIHWQKVWHTKWESTPSVKFEVRPQTETNKSPEPLLVMHRVKLKAAPGLRGSGSPGQEASSGAPSPHTLTPPPLEVFIKTQLPWAVWSAEGEKNQPERKSLSRSCEICYRSNLWLWQCKQQHQRSWVYLAKQILSIMCTLIRAFFFLLFFFFSKLQQ